MTRFGVAVSLALIVIQSAAAQTRALTFRPIDAEYSKSLDRLIAVSTSPNALNIYNAETGTNIAVPLNLAPTSVSVGPSGLYAAVGHDAKISYVNLVTAKVEREFTVNAVVRNLVLAASFVHVPESMSVNLTTGAVTGTAGGYYGTGSALHPSGDRIYGTRDGISPNDLHRFDVGTGPISKQSDSRYHGDYGICGQVWFSEDGKRVFNGCSTVFLSDPVLEKDMLYGGALEGRLGVRWMALSASAGRIAVVPGGPIYPPSESATDAEILFFDHEWLNELGRAPLEDFDVAGRKFKARGKWAFYDAAGTALYVVAQADSASGLLNDFAVQRIGPTPPAGCTWSLSATTATAPATGGSATVGVTTGAACAYQAIASAPWLKVLKGSYGAGTGTITYFAQANRTGAARTATVTAGGQTLTVNQTAVPPGSAGLTRLSVRPVDARYSKSLRKLVFISTQPNELRVLDPATGAETAVPLDLSPTALSLHPSDPFAMVGHDGSLSYVNLNTGAIEKRFSVPVTVNSVVLAANGFAYVFSRNTWGELISVRIATGEVSSLTWIYNGTLGLLHPSGKYIYTESSSKLDISQGTPKSVSTSFSSGGSCGSRWITEDGLRIIDACGTVFRSSEVQSEDGAYNGKLSPESPLTAADFSAIQQLIAAVPRLDSGSPADTQLRIFNYDYLTMIAQVATPQFPGGTKPGRGRYVFWSHNAQSLHVLMQADESDKLLPDYALWTLSPDVPQPGCTVAFGTTSASAPATGTSGQFTVTSGSSCMWKGLSNADWLTVDSGTFGFASGAIRYTARPNLTTSARTATITAGAAVFTVTQAAGSPSLCTYSVSTGVLSTPAAGVSAQVGLTAQGSSCAWTATSNVPWVQVFPLSGAGPQQLTVTVFPNFTPRRRQSLISIGGQLIDVSQSANAFPTNERFIRLLYFNHFGRQPSVAEVVSHLSAGTARGQLAVGFLGSTEFNMGGRYIAGLYRGLILRDAEFGGWLFQRNAMVTGATAPLTLVSSFLQSDEYRLKFGTPTNAEFVALLYRHILLREATPAEVAFQSASLATVSRAQMASTFLGSTEFTLGAGPRLTAFLLYSTLLSRDGSATELNAMETQLRAGTPLRTVVDSLLASPEFTALVE